MRRNSGSSNAISIVALPLSSTGHHADDPFDHRVKESWQSAALRRPRYEHEGDAGRRNHDQCVLGSRLSVFIVLELLTHTIPFRAEAVDRAEGS